MPKEDASVDYYAILGVSSSATADEVRKQFKKLALLYHPDRNVGKEAEFNTKFQSIQAAHELLTDPTRRRVYDRSRAVYRATTTTATTNGYSSNYRSTAGQTRTAQPNGAHSAYFTKSQATKEHAARAAQAQAQAQAHAHAHAHARAADADARRQHPASAWQHRKQTENWGYGQARTRREEVPRTPKKTRDNPYATDEYAARGSHTDEPRKESSGFFANRNPREKEWMQGDSPYGNGGGGGVGTGAAGARKFAAEAKASEQPHSAPRPNSTAYSFTPKQRVRMNLYEGAPRTQRSNDDFSTSSRGSPRMRSHAARESPPHATAHSNMHSRRKSSTSGIGSELNNSESSRFTYLFNKDGPRGPARSARHHRPPEVEDDDDDEDDFFVNLKNRRNAPPTAPPYAAKRQPSLGEEHLRGRGAEPRRASRTRSPEYRDVSPSTLSPSDSERESSVSPTPPSKPQADQESTRPKARMRIPKPRVDDASDVSSDSEGGFFPARPRRKPSSDRGLGFKFKFDTSSSQENVSNGVNLDPPTPPITATMPPVFDFSASSANQPPVSNPTSNGSQPSSVNFDPQAWMFSFANGQSNLFEPAQSPRKMPANNRMHTSFDAQGPLNFSRPRPASMAHPPDAGGSDIPRFSSPELESEAKRSRSEDRTEARRPPPPAPSSREQGNHAQQTTPAFVFQASEWVESFSINNPFEVKSKMVSGIGSGNGARSNAKNRKTGGGAIKKVPVSVFPIPPKPAVQPFATNNDKNSSQDNVFSIFAFAKTPNMQDTKTASGTGASTPSDTGLGGGLSGVSGAPSPMAMDLDTPNTSPPPKDKQAETSNPLSRPPGGTSDEAAQRPAPESNPFEPDRSARRTRSRSPKKMHKPTSSTSIKSNTAMPRSVSPPASKSAAAASSTNTMPRPKANSPKKARTRLSMDDLGAVPPFAVPQSTGGINGQWSDFADNLPFPSQAAPHVNLSPPASPKKEDRPTVPSAPIAPGRFTDVTDSAYRKYSNQMQTYQTQWNGWNEIINGHFRARLDLEVMACAQNQGLTGGAFAGGSDGIVSDLNSINKAIKDFEEDQQIQISWAAACKRHGDCLASWKVYLQALENREGS